MEDLNYNTTYTSGWQRIYRDKSEAEINIMPEIPDKTPPPIQRMSEIPSPIAEGTPPPAVAIEVSKAEELAEVSKFEQIIELIQKNHDDMAQRLYVFKEELNSLKQLLRELMESARKEAELEQKRGSGSKLSRFFK
ncbi:MAG: hypothetical protein N2376_10795 [Clostridia bacterium]|nr:hypothetical protein [Clostridia bacterium]